FFQAEDGIRDRNVTGVQTCALPISTGTHLYNGYATHFGNDVQCFLRFLTRKGLCLFLIGKNNIHIFVDQQREKFKVSFYYIVARSEERRVGKECRVWG